jgi:hypothetical protein
VPNEYWWNVDFDLALQPGWAPSWDEPRDAQIRELALHAVTAASPDDSVVVWEPPPEDFLHFLERCGVPTPRLSILPDIRPGFRFTPYGWSPQAIALKGRYDQPPPSPPIGVVRTVNGRSFGHSIEREDLESSIPRGAFASLSELQHLLRSEPDRPEGWVVKTEHGNAALGNRRLRTRQLDQRDLQWLSPRLEQGPMVLEWWLERTADLCSVFSVSEDGRVEDFTTHEAVHTADGGFIGALYDRTWPNSTPFDSHLKASAQTVAAALHAEGYFGPVCVDALVWDDHGSSRLRPLVDLNARRHASEGWRRLAGEWGGCLYGRFFSTRKLRLPATYEDFERALGADAWNPSTRSGALATSPLWLDGPGNRRRPKKVGVVFRGPSREAVFAMENRFREVFEK